MGFFLLKPFFSLLMGLVGGRFLFVSRFGGRFKHECRLFSFMTTFVYNDFIFIFINFSLCVLPTTVGSESTDCDDPYQWYTMHRQIKFVMIPDGSSSAPAYSLWQTLPFHCLPVHHTHLLYRSFLCFTVFLPLAGPKVPPHSCPRPISWLHLLHLRCASGSVC